MPLGGTRYFSASRGEAFTGWPQSVPGGQWIAGVKEPLLLVPLIRSGPKLSHTLSSGKGSSGDSPRIPTAL